MHTVSSRFAATVTSPHRIAVQAILVDSCPQFTTQPTGTVIPVIDGSVTQASITDVKATATITIPGTYWDAIQPYGTELYIRRGVEFGDGDAEYVGLGYFRVEQVSQENAPYGPIELTCLDRIAQMQQNQLVFPLPLSNGDSHRAVFDRLFNGIAIPQQSQYPGLPLDGYGCYNGARIPITWTSYNPDTTTIIGDQIVENDAWSFISTLIKWYNNSIIRFRNDGTMLVYSAAINALNAVATLTGGTGGVISSVKRVTKRTDVKNIVTAYGSDPTSITDYIASFNADPASKLAYNKTTYPQFGAAPTYYNSPLLQTDSDVELAGEELLRRFRMLPEVFTLSVVPNPALEPNDVIDVIMRPGLQPTRCIIDTITIPLTSANAGTITTRIPTATEGWGLGLGELGS